MTAMSWKRMLGWTVLIILIGIGLWLTGKASPLR